MNLGLGSPCLGASGPQWCCMNTRLSLPRWLTLSLLLGMLAAPLPARAHEARPAYLEIREMAPGRYSVLWRTPVMVVPVLALALFAGLRGAAYGRRALFVLPGAWLLGGVVGMAATSSRGSALTAISCLLLGGLLAADARLSLRTTTVLAVLVGLFHGYLNGAGMGQPGVGAVALLGPVFAVFVLVALAAALVVRLRRPWTRIAVGVIDSWVAASGLLMVGWAVGRG